MVARHEDILRFEVAMYNLLIVQVLYCFEQLAEYLLFLRFGWFGLEPFVQLQPVHILHHDSRTYFRVVAQLPYTHDIGAFQLRQQGIFALEQALLPAQIACRRLDGFEVYRRPSPTMLYI